MWVRNEEEWIGACILSARDFADEIVVADASTDSTPDIIRSVAEEYGFEDRVKLVYCDRADIAHQANVALKNTAYRWVSAWGGDFVARTSGEYDIRNLRKRILSLPDRYFMIYHPLLGLDGDLFHVWRDKPLLDECRCYTYSPELKYIYRHPGMFESIHFPPYYGMVHFPEVYIFHCKVDPPEYFLAWRFWRDWQSYRNENPLQQSKRFSNLDEYIRHRIRKEWQIDDYELAKAICFVEYAKNLELYDKERYDDYPILLKKVLDKPGCRIIYRDGRIVGRSDMTHLPDKILERIYIEHEVGIAPYGIK